RSALGNPLSWGHSLSFSSQSSELDSVGLQVVPLISPGGLFLIGSKEEVDRAANIMQKIEDGLSGPAKKEIIRYNVKHTDPVELGKVIAKICRILATAGPPLSEEEAVEHIKNAASQVEEERTGVSPLVVPGGLAKFSEEQRGSTWGDYNVVVDMKTSTLFLAIETYLSQHILDLIKKLDVPEKMVRIDFILFEKSLTERGESGISLISIGSEASGNDSSGVRFPGSSTTSLRRDFGILQFFLSSSAELLQIPPFDFAFNFLVGQEDIQIHANPSLLTMNGTTAVINLVEETSVNVGQTAVPSGGSTLFKDSYVRAQYGIKIRVKPVIHEEENERYITMDCDLTFESHRGGVEGRPEIHTRNIKNLCRIRDQESVIIGGLRQKDIEDRHNGLPILGELPLFRSFFGYNTMSDRSTETFVLIRPQIIDSLQQDAQVTQLQALKRRPGDLLPAPLKKYGRRTEGIRAKLPQTFKLIFGR
uniref:type II secretion system protein GspD n=1 Tax=Candidatus Similichlamydia epinepheli TaxID=1903953 RepID=UPI00195A4B03